MRIALLLSGQPRFVKEVAPIILANVIGDYNVDTFCHFWFDDKLQSEPYKYGECNKGEWHKQRISADAIDEAIEAYHPVELITEPSKSFADSTVPFEGHSIVIGMVQKKIQIQITLEELISIIVYHIFTV